MITKITSLIRKVSYDSSPDTHQKYTRITMSIGVQHRGQLMPVLIVCYFEVYHVQLL